VSFIISNILKEYGTVTDEPSRGPKSDKFSVFNYMTASSRFEKAKTTGISQVSIFGQLNEGLTPVVKQQAVTVIGGLTGEKIEFDSKASAATVATSIFSDDGPALLETTQKTDDNIYMQVQFEWILIDFFLLLLINLKYLFDLNGLFVEF